MRKVILPICFSILLLIPIRGYSKTMAYLLTADEVIKFDTDADAIVTRVKAATGFEGYFAELGRAGCAVDLNSKRLITLADVGQSNRGGFYIYDLQTSMQVKFVTFPGTVKEPILAKIIYPQVGTRFYIEVNDMSLNNGSGGMVSLAYDKKTLNYIETVNNLLLSLRETFWFSADQGTIYVNTDEGNLRAYNSQTLALTNTIDLSNIYAANLWNKSVNDIRGGVALLEENKKTKLTDKNNLSFFTYKITDGTISPRFSSGIDDKATLLTPNATKIILNEKIIASSSGPKAPAKGSTVTGRIHVYTVATGKKLGLVTIPTDFGEKILGIRPQSDKLYYLKYSKNENNIRLYVVNLTTLQVIKELTVPNLYFMVFFDE